MPLAGPAPNAPVETLWVLLTAFLHGEPAPRAGNPGFSWGSRPVAEVYIAPRAVEWLIRRRRFLVKTAQTYPIEKLPDPVGPPACARLRGLPDSFRLTVEYGVRAMV